MSLVMHFRRRVGVRLIYLEVSEVQRLVLDAIVGTVVGTGHITSEAAVNTELVADVPGTLAPHVDVGEFFFRQDFAVADALHLDVEITVVRVVHYRGDLYPLVFKVFQGQIVNDGFQRRFIRIARVDNLYPAVGTVGIGAWGNRNKG